MLVVFIVLGPGRPGAPLVPFVPGGPCAPLVPLAPGGPCAPLAPGGPCAPLAPGGPCGPCGPCVPVVLSLLWSFLSSNLTCLQNSTELTKKPSNGPVLHSYFL